MISDLPHRDTALAHQPTIQKQVAAWTEFEAEIRELVASGRITPEDAAARLSENAESYFDEIKITADKVFPEKERKQLNVFWEEAARNTTAITRMWTGEVVLKGLAVTKDSSWEK